MDQAQSKPFMFDKSFDLAALKKQEEIKKAKTFSEKELEDVRQQAYAEGVSAGKNEAIKDIQQQQSVLLGNITRIFERLAGDVWHVYDQQKNAATDIALTIARKLVPNYLEKSGPKEIVKAIETSLTDCINEPRLVLRIHEQHFDYIKGELEKIVDNQGYSGKLIILADDKLTPHDCRLEWADGGMERNVNVTWSEIEKHAARYAANPAPQNTQPIPAQQPPAPDTAPASTNLAV